MSNTSAPTRPAGEHPDFARLDDADLAAIAADPAYTDTLRGYARRDLANRQYEAAPILVIWSGSYASLVTGPYATEQAARQAIVEDAAEWEDPECDLGQAIRWGKDDNGNERADYADDMAFATIVRLGAA